MDAFNSLSSSAESPSLMAYYSASRHPAKTAPFPQPPATAQPPLLPLPAHLQAPPQHPSWPAGRPVVRAKKPRVSPKKQASAPVAVAAPSKKRTAAAAAVTEQEAEWAEDSLYSVSPPPSSVPMPTSLLVAAAGRKVPTACAVEMVGGGVDVGATDELRRLLRL